MRLHIRLLVPPRRREAVRELARFFVSRSKKDIKALGLNGCGAKGGWINPPDLDFRNACEFHDLLYMQGGDRRDRLAADALFLDLMLDSIGYDARCVRSSSRRFGMFIAAHIYFVAVRLFGAKHFRFGDKLTVSDLSRRLWIKRGTR